MTNANTDVGVAMTNDSRPGEADERLAYRGLGQRMLIRPEIVGMMASVLLFMFFWGVTRPFGNAGGAATVLDVSATLGIMAVAVGVLMIGGEFDLSSGAMTGAMAIVIVLLVKDTGDLGGAGITYWIAIPISLLVALGIGWLNGTMVERTALPSFIVTLATFFVLRGLKLAGSKIMVDQIQVGRADEGPHYDFWQNIFGSTWIRGDHVWEGRDAAYTVLCLLGAVIVVAAVYQLSFARRPSLNSAGVVLLGLGVVGIAGGVVLTHVLDGTDWLPMLVIAAGGFASVYGLGAWRFSLVVDRGNAALPVDVTRPLMKAAGYVSAAVVAALVFDSADDTNIVPFVTEQGLRAILFMVLLALGATQLVVAATRSTKVSVAARSLVIGIASVTTLLLALFVQSESTSHKFRAELFTQMCVVALLLGCYALASYFFETRTAEDPDADSGARRLAVIGGLLVLAGIVVRMLFAVQAEIDAEDPSRLAAFSIRIVWFLGFAAVMTYVLKATPWGGWVYAVGGNKEAARQIGVPAARTKTQLFMLVAAAAWLVGILLAFRLNTIQAGTGNGLEFEYIIAAVVGGTLLTGGYGTALGAAIGAVIMAMAKQGISFAGWNTDWRFVFIGSILLIAVYANGAVRKVAEAAR